MKEEQIDGLIRLIEENGFATVKYLAKVTFTSESTVRRQLTELENMGLIKRSYGGAEIRKDNVNTPIELRLQKNHKAKDAIARKAAALVRDNETVFIDSSSTCLHMGQYLAGKKGLTVYTYAAELCEILARYGICVYCLGGRYDKVSKAFTGEYALKMIQSIYFDAFFFSDSGFCDGIISDYNEAETHMRRALLAQSARKYFLCDSEKFGKRSPYILCTEKDIDGIITE